jgi:hypothetical protein
MNRVQSSAPSMTPHGGLFMRSSNHFRLGLGFMALNVIASFASIASVTVSPGDVAAGGSATGKVTLDDLARTTTTVTLSNTTPAVATVPASVFIGGKSTSASFPITTHAAGCALISAHIGTTTAKSALLYVAPPAQDPNLKLTLSKSIVIAGSPVTATLLATVNSATPATSVQIVGSTEHVTVPSSVNLNLVEGGVGTATFTVGTTSVNAPTCAVITVTHNGVQSRALLKINPAFFG